MELREAAQSDEIRDLSDENYMMYVLNLANWRAGDVPDFANYSWRRLTSDTSQWTGRHGNFRLDPSVEVAESALQFGGSVRSHLGRYLAGDHRALRAMRATADAAVDQIKVRTQLRVSERGALIHLHSYAAGAGDGPLGLFLSFLLDPDRRFGRDLRRCRLKECERFYFVPPRRKGGRIPSFCPDSDHQRRYDALAARKRAMNKRAKPKVSHKS
jgi:hypothetical protein